MRINSYAQTGPYPRQTAKLIANFFYLTVRPFSETYHYLTVTCAACQLITTCQLRSTSSERSRPVPAELLSCLLCVDAVVSLYTINILINFITVENERPILGGSQSVSSCTANHTIYSHNLI